MEVRIMRRRPDESYHPTLDVRQQDVLLGFIETMDLVDE